MDEKFLGYIAYPPDYPIYDALEYTAEVINQWTAEGYVTYLTYTAADESVSDEVGLIISSEPITKEEAKEALTQFIKDSLDEEEGDEDDNV